MGATMLMAVIAHEGARETIADFQPRWQKLRIPIVAFLPEGDQWPGAPVQFVHNQGSSAHRGDKVFERFLLMCQTLLLADFDYFLIMEYDTVNLKDTFPSINAAAVNTSLMDTWGAGARLGQILALSPWLMSRAMLAALIEAMKMQIRKPSCAQWVDGLLDRWLGVAIQDAKLPYAGLQNNIPWCDDRWPMMDMMKECDCNFVHGFKRKAQFQNLWPNP